MRRTSAMVVACLLSMTAGCGGDEAERPAAEPAPEATPEPVVERALRDVVGRSFAPLPPPGEVDRERVALGRDLFHDPRLSGDSTISCATCHMLSHGGAEPRATSVGIRGQVGPINAPTVLNSGFNFVQFWDGRAADLLAQAAGPVENPLEMNGDWPTILERLSADAALRARFVSEFGEGPITQANVLTAIAAYEEYLATPSPFDRWLGGDDDALDEAQERGLRLFVSTGCTTCHEGRNVGGGSYQRMGLVHDYFERRGGTVTPADLGRFNVTQDEADRHRFKVPTLRNVALTSPYFHDGSEPELAGAVRTMAYVQLNRELEDTEVADIVAFLGALTGEIPADAYMPGAAGAPAPEAAAEAPNGDAVQTNEAAAAD